MIYLDNNASTCLSDAVIANMKLSFSELYANPSSLHRLGKDVRIKLEAARRLIADSIGALPEEILFTSSGTEANNLCLKGFAFANRHLGNHIVTSKIEHPSVLNTCAYLEKQGFRVTYLDVDKEGFINAHDLEMCLSDETILISIIHANNEIGTIQPLEELAAVHPHIAFHTDAVQSFLKEDFNVKALNLSMASFSAHKFHAPKGVGFVYKKKNVVIQPDILGGKQEMGLRAGTENVVGILAAATAIKEFSPESVTAMKEKQQYLIKKLLSIPGIRLNGPFCPSKRLCNNVNFSCDRLEGEEILQALSRQNIFVSTASACSSLHTRVSHVLKAISCPSRYIQGSIRIGISRYTSMEEIDTFLKAFTSILSNLNSPFRLHEGAL